MKQTFYILTMTLLLTACNQSRSTNNAYNSKDTINTELLSSTTSIVQPKQKAERIAFRHVSEIVADSSYSTWVLIKGSNPSLALHFQYKDTLAVSYSSECWLMFPYKLEGAKIVVYWDNNIDTKYDFDIVKAINKTDKKYIGQPFMILELENDTTLKATYPIKELVRKLNSSGKKRVFFPDNYEIVQDGFL